MRDEAEVKFSRALARILQDQKKRLLERFRTIFRVIDWQKEDEILLETIIPYLEKNFMDGVEVANADIFTGKAIIPSEITSSLMIEAFEWAAEYGRKLVTAINATTRNVFTKAITTYFSRAGVTVQDVADKVAWLFGPSRAWTIAVTEITRAYAEAGKETMKKYEEMGIPMEEVWHTSNDELVCPVCGPRNNKPKEGNWSDYPPLHPHCRCRVMHRMKR